MDLRDSGNAINETWGLTWVRGNPEVEYEEGKGQSKFMSKELRVHLEPC